MQKVIIVALGLGLLSTTAFAQSAVGVGAGISSARSGSEARSQSNNAVNSTQQQQTSVRSANINANANQSGAQAGNTNTFNSTTVGQSPSVFAPGMSAAGIESCNGSVSLGGAAVGGGGALGFPWQDGPCNKRLNARTLWAFGQREAAVQVLCQDDEVATALIASGVRCRIGRYAQPYTTVSVHAGHPVYKAEYKSDYVDKKGRHFTIADCHSKGARPSADAGVCVKLASN